MCFSDIVVRFNILLPRQEYSTSFCALKMGWFANKLYLVCSQIWLQLVLDS